METNFQKIKAICKVCKGQNLKFFAEKNNCKIYKCCQCGLIFVWPIPENLPDIYHEDYFSGARRGFGYVDYERDKAPMIGTFEYFLEMIEKISGRKGKLLDVGAASGFFLEIARKYKWDVSGVEISEFASLKAREKGFQVMTGTVEDLRNCGEYFDVITMWDVIEHMPDLAKTLGVACELLSDNGVIAINTPDSNCLFARIMGKNWHSLIPPEHLAIFNQKNLSDLLKKQGFKILFITKKGKKFTLQYIFQILANWRQESGFFRMLSKFFSSTFLGQISLSVNLRDNFFIIARKL